MSSHPGNSFMDKLLPDGRSKPTKPQAVTEMAEGVLISDEFGGSTAPADCETA